MVQADHRNHALHAVQGDLQYHAVQQYLGVQGYQRHPAQKEITVSYVLDFQKTHRISIMDQKGNSDLQGLHQSQQILSLH